MDGVTGARLCEVVGCDAEELSGAAAFGWEFDDGDGDGDMVGLPEGRAGDRVLADAHGREEGEERCEGNVDFRIELEDVEDAEVLFEDLVTIILEEEF